MSSPPSIGVRALKNQTSGILRRVRAGETLVVTDRDEPIALLVPIARAPEEAALRALVAQGLLAWDGGKPVGSRRPARVRGASVAEAVSEDRG